jgi:hypothetical protein
MRATARRLRLPWMIPVALLGLGLGGCVYAPPAPVAYAPPAGYAYSAPAYYYPPYYSPYYYPAYYPPVVGSVGFFFGGGGHHHFH